MTASASATATATVKGGFFAQYGASIASIQGRNAMRRRVAQALGTRQLLYIRELAETLDGATAGSAASKTIGQIAAAEELGGKRTVSSVALVNRNTASADITEINADLLSLSSRTTFGASPVANKDGNPLGTR